VPGRNRPALRTPWQCAPWRNSIQHNGRSKHVDEFQGEPFDLVVTVSDDAAENCPVWLGQGQRVHLGFPDPA